MSRVAIYPGSFDPITRGHLDLIDRTTQLFDRVIVSVATNTRKATWLDVDQRISLVKETLTEYPTVQDCHAPALLLSLLNNIRLRLSCADYALRLITKMNSSWRV